MKKLTTDLEGCDNIEKQIRKLSSNLNISMEELAKKASSMQSGRTTRSGFFDRLSRQQGGVIHTRRSRAPRKCSHIRRRTNTCRHRRRRR